MFWSLFCAFCVILWSFWGHLEQVNRREEREIDRHTQGWDHSDIHVSLKPAYLHSGSNAPQVAQALRKLRAERTSGVQELRAERTTDIRSHTYQAFPATLS